MKHIQKYYFLTSVGTISLIYTVTISSNILQSVQCYFKYFLKSYERHSLSNILGCSGRRGGEWNGDRRAQSWTGGGGGLGLCDVAPPRLGVSRFTILSRFFVMLVFLFCKLFARTANLSHNNSPIIKTKHFMVTKYKKLWQIFRPKWVKKKIFVIILFYEWMMHLYRALLCAVVHPKQFEIMCGGGGALLNQL